MIVCGLEWIGNYMALLCNAFYMSVGLLIRGVPDMKLWTSLLGYVDPILTLLRLYQG